MVGGDEVAVDELVVFAGFALVLLLDVVEAQLIRLRVFEINGQRAPPHVLALRLDAVAQRDEVGEVGIQELVLVEEGARLVHVVVDGAHFVGRKLLLERGDGALDEPLASLPIPTLDGDDERRK